MTEAEKLKKTLEHCVNDCGNVECCENECPYSVHCMPGNVGLMVEVPVQLLRDCIVYIDQVETGLDQLEVVVNRLGEHVRRLDDDLK